MLILLRKTSMAPWRELVLATELTKGIPAKGRQTVRLVSGESAEGEVVR